MIDFIAGSEHEVTAILAYRLWEKRGRPVGSPDLDWFEAEKQRALSQKSQPPLTIFGFAMEANERP